MAFVVVWKTAGRSGAVMDRVSRAFIASIACRGGRGGALLLKEGGDGEEVGGLHL